MIHFVFWGTDFRLDDNCILERHYKQTKRWKVLNNNKPNKSGKLFIGLKNDMGIYRQFPIEKLIFHAHNPEYEIENTAVCNDIVHIDKNRQNNHIDNLKRFEFK